MNEPQVETIWDRFNKLEERAKKIERFLQNDLLESFKFKAAVRGIVFESDDAKWNIQNEARLRVIIKRLLREASLKVEFP